MPNTPGLASLTVSLRNLACAAAGAAAAAMANQRPPVSESLPVCSERRNQTQVLQQVRLAVKSQVNETKKSVFFFVTSSA